MLEPFEFIDYSNNSKKHKIKLEDIIKQEQSYSHTLYVNFVDYISEIYKSCNFNIKDLEHQVTVDVERSNVYINDTKLNKRNNKSERFLSYIQTKHPNNYVKILCLHNQAIYANALHLLLNIIDDPEVHIFELDSKKRKKNLMMKLLDKDSLQFMSTKTLRIVKINKDIELPENLFLVYIRILYTFNETKMVVTFTIDKYKDVIS